MADSTTTPLQEGAPLIRWLRAALWGAFIIPAGAFILLALWGYQRAYRDAEINVAHASALSLRQAERTFETARKIAMLGDVAASAPDEAVRAHELAVHQRLSDLTAGLTSIINLNIWDVDGRSLARSDLFPADPDASIADRPYFLEQKKADIALGISDVIVGRQSTREIINVTIRRRSSDGRFNGIVAVSLSPEFFRDYYRSLASDEPNVASFAMVRTDGAILARWPKLLDDRTHVEANNPIFHKVLAGESEGYATIEKRDVRPGRLVSFRRVGDLPIYVAAGVDRGAMMAYWLRFLAFLASIFVPISLGLVYVSWVALKKTRLEQDMLVAMQSETQRRAQAERALLESQKLDALSQLTGGVAHDFNNLLTIVSNNLHIVSRRHPELKEDRSVTAIARAVTSGVRLTRQLLSFSRKQALRPELVHLQDWLPKTEGLLKSSVGSNSTVVFSVDPDTAPITVDLAELELALINTALNAHHAMPEGGELRIRASNSRRAQVDGRPMVDISIEDAGRGIAPEILGRVFEPFFSTKGEGKGSGLGLSQVQGLAEQSGGFATIDSEVGRGTTVSMYFPATPVSASAGALLRRDDDRVLQGRVLLVEDNDDVATVTEQLLSASGLTVFRAPNADDALNQLIARDTETDMILSDISMPGTMDGIQFAFVVRQRWPHLPILLMTGFAERISDALAAHVPVLAKPVHPAELLDEIGKLLIKPEATTA
jgi:two-component system, NtrC family, sensor kinase